MKSIPAYTIAGITRPELFLDFDGNIILTPAALAFADQYGLKALYLGCPPGTPFPPVPGFIMTTPVDTNTADNIVAENAAANTTVGITAEAHDIVHFPITYSLTADSSGGGFKINATTGVVTVDNPHQINFEASASHSYNITVRATDGIFATTQTFTINVSDVAPTTPTDTNGAANTVVEGAANGTAVGVTANSTDVHGGTVTYSIAPGGDSSGGGFTVNATTGVVTVADATKIDYESAPGHAYTVTVVASDGTLTSSQTFTIAVTRRSGLDTGRRQRGRQQRDRRRRQRHARSASPPPPPTSTAGVDLCADRRHLARRLHHQCRDRRRHRRRLHQDQLTKARRDTPTPSPCRPATALTTSSQTFTIAVTDVAPTAPTDSNARGQHRRGRRRQRFDRRRHRVLDRRQRPGRDLFADRRHLRRRLHHQRHDRRRHRRRRHQDRLREHRAGHAYTVTAQASDGTLSSSQTFTIAVTDVAPTAPTDSDGAANTVVEGAANGSTVGVTAASTDINGPARDLLADRRHFRRRLRHQRHDRRRHRRRFHQDRFRKLRRQLHRHRAGQRRHADEFADLHHRGHGRSGLDAGRHRQRRQQRDRRRRQRLDGRRHRLRHRPERAGLDLCADRRLLARRLHHQCRDRRRHRRRLHQDQLRERAGTRLQHHRAGHRRR